MKLSELVRNLGFGKRLVGYLRVEKDGRLGGVFVEGVYGGFVVSGLGDFKAFH